MLLAPSLTALQTLIDLCFNFAVENDILYNETKVQCMAVWPRSFRQEAISFVSSAAYLKFVDEAV